MDTAHPVPPPLPSDHDLWSPVYLLTQLIQQARVDHFLALKQSNISVREYSLRFDSLARYAPSIVATIRDRIHMFVAGLALELTKACATAALQDSMDISQIQAFAQNIERGRRRQLGTERTEQGQHKMMIFSRGHLGQCRAGSDACYTYGRQVHMMQDCPNRDSGGMAKPMSLATGSSMSVHPSRRKSQSLAGRGRPAMPQLIAEQRQLDFIFW
uniref:Uncharacterized protein LOC104216962 n=1 Tax=Nicotiana sylvestris TaxID=4096 RepID=A0A1U7VSR4_NICSY